MFGGVAGGLFGAPSQTASPGANLFGTPQPTMGGLATTNTSSNTGGGGGLFGQNTGLFGGGAASGGFGGGAASGGFGGGSTGGGLFGAGATTQQNNQNTSVGQTPQSSLFATPANTTFGATPAASVFGSTPAVTAFGATPMVTAFGATPAVTAFGATPATTAFGTAGGGLSGGTLFGTALGAQGGQTSNVGGVTNSNLFGSKPEFVSTWQSNQLETPAEVHAVLSNLSNADARSQQVLTEIFLRLKSLVSERPTLVSFTYDVDLNTNSLQQRKSQLEQQVGQIVNKNVLEAYANAQKRNPDPSKYLIVPLQNFDGLVRRAEMQMQTMEKLNAVLAEFKGRQERVGNHMKIVALKRLDDIAKRQHKMQSSLMRVVGFLEGIFSESLKYKDDFASEYAMRTSRAQIDYAYLKRLQSEIGVMTEDLHNSSADRHELTDVACRLSLLGEKVGVDVQSRSNKTDKENESNKEERIVFASLTERDYKVIVKILQKQQALFESLGVALRQDTTRANRLLELAETNKSSDVFKTPQKTDDMFKNN